MASWFDGISDSLSGFVGDVADIGTNVYQNITEQEKAKTERVKNENATATEQARIDLERDKLAAQQGRAEDKQKLFMYGGAGLLVLVVLFLLFRK